MSKATVFVTNRTQALSPLSDVRLPEGSQNVEIRARGNDGTIAPLGQTWDSFFWAARQSAMTSCLSGTVHLNCRGALR